MSISRIGDRWGAWYKGILIALGASRSEALERGISQYVIHIMR